MPNPNPKIWINIPAGCRLELQTSGTGDYTVHADVLYDPPECAIDPGDRIIPKSQLDPGPPFPPVKIPAPGTVNVTVVITFPTKNETSVTVKAVIKKDGVALPPEEDSKYEVTVKGTSKSGAALVDIFATGKQKPAGAP